MIDEIPGDRQRTAALRLFYHILSVSVRQLEHQTRRAQNRKFRIWMGDSCTYVAERVRVPMMVRRAMETKNRVNFHGPIRGLVNFDRRKHTTADPRLAANIPRHWCVVLVAAVGLALGVS